MTALQLTDSFLDESWVEGVTEEGNVEMQRVDSNLFEIIKRLQQGFCPPWSEMYSLSLRVL